MDFWRIRRCQGLKSLEHREGCDFKLKLINVRRYKMQYKALIILLNVAMMTFAWFTLKSIIRRNDDNLQLGVKSQSLGEKKL